MAEPDSDIAKVYMEAAEAVWQALAKADGGAVRQFPEIKISDD